MASILGIATTGLQAFQQSIATVGQNIANVNTEGYSRQSVVLSTRSTTRLGTSFVGNGVQVDSIVRYADQIINLQLRNAIGVNSEVGQFQSHAANIDSLLADPATSVVSSLNKFFASLQTVVDRPDYSPARQAFLSQADLLVNRFHTLDESLTNEYAMTGTEMARIVDKINLLAKNIAEVNKKVIGSNPAPELLDQRDQLVNQLSEVVAVTVIEQSNGAFNINIGNGQALVIEGVAAPLTTVLSSEDPRQRDIAFSAGSATVTITSQIKGGALGGLLSYIDQVVAPVQLSLDRIALGLASSFNAQHQLGMDANNNIGATFFNDINSLAMQQGRVIAHSNNGGNAVLNVSVNTLSAITNSDYSLTVATGPAYTLTRLSDNTTTNFAGFPQTVDGFTINLASGTANAGDRFIISPTRNMARDLDLNVKTTAGLALAAPIRSSESTANIGTGVITPGVVVDTTNAAFTTTPGQLSPPLRIEFLSTTSYQLVNATTSAVIEGPIAYNPAANNALFPTPGAFDPGYRLELNGAPATGDTFSIEYNSGGIGDSRNAALLADIQQQKLLDKGKVSLNDAYAEAISDLGSKTNAAKVNFEASAVLLQQAQAKRDNLSGVSLDEEAANLLRFEQAYQATAQLLNVASQLFNTLLTMIGR